MEQLLEDTHRSVSGASSSKGSKAVPTEAMSRQDLVKELEAWRRFGQSLQPMQAANSTSQQRVTGGDSGCGVADE